MSLNTTTTVVTTTPVVTTTAVSNTIIVLNVLLKNFVNHFPIAFTILGFIGFIGNALTYLHPDFRSNTCCIYLLCSSIVDIIFLLFNLLSNYLSGMFGIPVPWERLPNLCKFLIFTLGFFPHLSINFLLMSIIDRFACTCKLTSVIRRINRLKMVPFLIGIAMITSCIASLNGPIFYNNTGNGCVVSQALHNSIWYIIVNGVTQPVAMLVFLLLTYRNVRESRRRVGGTTTGQPHRSRNQFITMIFTQVIVTAFIALQWLIMYIYYHVSSSSGRTSEQQTIVSFVFYLTDYCYFLNNVKSFYVSMATSRVFRQTFRKTLFSMLPRHLRRRWQVSEVDMPIMTVTKRNPQNMTKRVMTTAH